MRFDLLPGECDIPQETVSGVKELLPPVTLDRVDGDNSEYNKYEAINQQGNYGLTEEGESISGDLPWQKLIDGNGLDRDSTETSRGFDTTDNNLAATEVFEPVLRKDKSINKGRNLEGFAGDQVEIVEPILRSTTRRTVSPVRPHQLPIPPQQTNRQSRDEQGFLSVQLFPFRLGELLERAERYARQTLLPLISETAPRFFGFGTVVSEESPAPVEVATAMDRTGKDLRVTYDQIESESKPKNIYESLRETGKEENSTEKVVQSRSIKDVKFYSNDNDLNNVVTEKFEIERSDEALVTDRRGHQITLDDIRIDLPTYRPPSKQLKDFPYEFVHPDDEESTTTATLEVTTTVPTESTTKKEEMERSWLKFDIPVFRALSRSFQDWTSLSSSPNTATASGAATSRRSDAIVATDKDSQQTDGDKRQGRETNPIRRFIPLLFGGFR